MLAQAVTILSSGGSSGAYTATVLFSSTSKAKYVAVGDYLKDRTDNIYQIDSHSALPNDFSSGGTLTVSYVSGAGGDIAPTTFSSFGDASVYTPGQVDVRPAVRSGGLITGQNVDSGKDYIYEITANWFDSGSAGKAAVNDYVVDNNGKLFKITEITGINATTVKAQEVHKEGEAPAFGGASLFRPTSNYKFFQGTELTDPARTFVFNRDKFIIDQYLGSGGGGGGGALVKVMENKSGTDIPAGMAVSKKSDGSVVLADSDSADGQTFVGVAAELLPNNGTGDVYLVGQNIPGALAGLGFSPGDDIFISQTAGFTNDPGSFTGGDDTITRVGIADCAAGTASATATDLIIFAEIEVTP